MNIVIIGAGPSGMMAAISSSKLKTNKVFLIEKNEKLGKKLFITGKGRCNVTNACNILDFKKNIIHNEKFMNSALSKFSNEDFISFLNENSCPVKVERGLRVFPTADKSYAITDCFKRLLKINAVSILLNTEVKKIDLVSENPNQFKIKTTNEKNNKENILIADKVIIATGGFSYQSTGSTGDGYKFAKNFNIDITNIKPALVPMRIDENKKTKKNILLKNIGIKITNQNKIYYQDFGDLEFYINGVKGPTILTASSKLIDYVDAKTLNFTKDFDLRIDFKPAITNAGLDKRLIREIENNNKCNLFDLYKKLLPIEIISNFHKFALPNVDIDIPIYKITKEYRKEILYALKNFVVKLIGLNGFNEAIITAGGINCKEIDPKTMESKKIKGLYFIGEVLDIDCLTGGFNITIAVSTGFVAGCSASGIL